MASRICSVGLVTVSERRSITDKSLTTCALCSLAGAPLHQPVPFDKLRAHAQRGLREQILKSKGHVGLDGIGSLDAASSQALCDQEGELQ